MLLTIVIVTFFCIGSSDLAMAQQDKAEKEMLGVWVPKGIKSCNYKIRIEVSEEQLILHYNNDSMQFGDFGLCHTCPGGIRHTGIETWLLTGFENPDAAKLTLQFNDSERKGIMTAAFIDRELALRFPIEKYDFIKCKKNK